MKTSVFRWAAIEAREFVLGFLLHALSFRTIAIKRLALAICKLHLLPLTPSIFS